MFGNGVPDQNGVWLSICGVANMSSGRLLIRCGVSVILSDPYPGNVFGAVSLIYVSLNEGGVNGLP